MSPTTTIDSSPFNRWTEDIDKARKDLGIQGTCVVVVHKGEVIYAQGFGRRNDTDPFTPETLVWMASLTKSFTAAAIGELVAKGQAKWDVPVSEYLPEFRLKDPRLTSEINFIDILSHRTGLPSLTLEWRHRPEPRIELIKKMKYVEASAPIRSEWIYNNVMVVVAGEAASRIANKPYEELVLESVIRPLGMTETGFSLKEMVTKPNHALPYSSKNFAAARNGETYRIPLDTAYRADAPTTDLYSNAMELARWAKAIMHNGVLDGQQVLNKSTIEQLHTPYCIMGRRPRGPEFSFSAYGLSWMLEYYKGHRTIHHNGSSGGYRHNMVLFPDDDLAVINLSNNLINELVRGIPYYIADDVLKLSKTRDWLFGDVVRETQKIYKRYGKENPADVETDLPPQLKGKPMTHDLADFSGEYTHPIAGKIVFKLTKTTIKTEDGKGDEKKDEDALAFEAFGYKGISDHHHFDSFRLRAIGERKVFSALATFVTSGDGLVHQCRLSIGGGGLRVFTKVGADAESDIITKDE